MFYAYKTSQALEKYLHLGFREGVFACDANTELILRELRPRLDGAIYPRTMNCYFLRQAITNEKTTTKFALIYGSPDRRPIRGFVTVESISFGQYIKALFKRILHYWVIDNSPYYEDIDEETSVFTK